MNISLEFLIKKLILVIFLIFTVFFMSMLVYQTNKRVRANKSIVMKRIR